MAETPKYHDPDPPLASSVAEENKSSLTSPHHTPEPWHISRHGINHRYRGWFEIWNTPNPDRDLNGKAIAVVATGKLTEQESRANGELLLRAPRMLRLLRETLARFDTFHQLFPGAMKAYNLPGLPLEAEIRQLIAELEKAGVL